MIAAAVTGAQCAAPETMLARLETLEARPGCRTRRLALWKSLCREMISLIDIGYMNMA